MKLYTIIVSEQCYESEEQCILGRYRTVGIYTRLELAEEAIRKNIFDIWETLYDYVFIEEIDSDILYPSSNKMTMFKYDINKKEYVKIEIPNCVKNMYTITDIG